MNHETARSLKSTLLFGLLFMGVVVFSYAAPVKGKDYTQLLKPISEDRRSDKISVTEFFSYACSHCYKLEPYLLEWSKSAEGVRFGRRPLPFPSKVVALTRGFYIAHGAVADEADALKLEATHLALFKAMQEQKREFKDARDVEAFYKSAGISIPSFGERYEKASLLAIATSSNWFTLTRAKGVPALLIDGRYVVTGKGPEEMINIAKGLVQMVKNEREEAEARRAKLELQAKASMSPKEQAARAKEAEEAVNALLDRMDETHAARERSQADFASAMAMAHEAEVAAEERKEQMEKKLLACAAEIAKLESEKSNLEWDQAGVQDGAEDLKEQARELRRARRRAESTGTAFDIGLYNLSLGSYQEARELQSRQVAKLKSKINSYNNSLQAYRDRCESNGGVRGTAAQFQKVCKLHPSSWCNANLR